MISIDGVRRSAEDSIDGATERIFTMVGRGTPPVAAAGGALCRAGFFPTAYVRLAMARAPASAILMEMVVEVIDRRDFLGFCLYVSACGDVMEDVSDLFFLKNKKV